MSDICFSYVSLPQPSPNPPLCLPDGTNDESQDVRRFLARAVQVCVCVRVHVCVCVRVEKTAVKCWCSCLHVFLGVRGDAPSVMPENWSHYYKPPTAKSISHVHVTGFRRTKSSVFLGGHTDSADSGQRQATRSSYHWGQPASLPGDNPASNWCIHARKKEGKGGRTPAEGAYGKSVHDSQTRGREKVGGRKSRGPSAVC